MAGDSELKTFFALLLTMTLGLVLTVSGCMGHPTRVRRVQIATTAPVTSMVYYKSLVDLMRDYKRTIREQERISLEMRKRIKVAPRGELEDLLEYTRKEAERLKKQQTGD